MSDTGMNFTRPQLEQDVQRVLDAMMTLGVPQKALGDGLQEAEKAGQGILYIRDFGINVWDWPQGVGLYGMEKLENYYGDTRYDDFLDQWYHQRIAEGLPSKNVNTTAPYLVLQGLGKRSGNAEYAAMCRARAEWLMTGLPRTEEGGFQHVTTGLHGKDTVNLNEQQMWVDTLFMAVLFLAREGTLCDKKEWRAEAVRQMLLHIKYLCDKKTGLFFHGWSFLRRDNFGAVLWSRGNAWFAYGVLELLETLGKTVDEGTRQFLLGTFHAQMDALLPLQAKSGLWHTVLDDSESYEEVSGSAAFCAAMYKGMRIGLLPQKFLPCANRALAAICANIGPDGLVANVSAGTGVGMDHAHYRKIAIAPIGYGQSMTALALVEALEYRAAAACTEKPQRG